MIGFLALAGIIVRDPILLVHLIRHGAGEGKTLRQASPEAGAVRFKPILLTALDRMKGAADDFLISIRFSGLGYLYCYRIGIIDFADRVGDPRN